MLLDLFVFYNLWCKNEHLEAANLDLPGPSQAGMAIYLDVFIVADVISCFSHGYPTCMHQCKYDWISNLTIQGLNLYMHFLLEPFHSLSDWPGCFSHSGQALNLTTVYFLCVMAAAILSGAGPSTCHPSIKGSVLRFTVCVFLLKIVCIWIWKAKPITPPPVRACSSK